MRRKGIVPAQRKTPKMTNTVQITGYIESAECAHCGRELRHGIRIDDGSTVGAQCFAKKITAPRRHYSGKTFRLDAAAIIHIAKVMQRTPAHTWNQYGVNEASRTFQRVA